jgi:hypothetical protein
MGKNKDNLTRFEFVYYLGKGNDTTTYNSVIA